MRDTSLQPEPLILSQASVQEIQLELIRQRKFNRFEGPKIVASLTKHRKLWRAVLMDRLGFTIDTGDKADAGLSAGSLSKLRGLCMNRWGVDDLYILCDSEADANEWLKIAEYDEWLADNLMVHGSEEASRALGEHPASGHLVSFWWD